MYARNEVLLVCENVDTWGCITFFLASLGACLRFDLKRVVAMSTLGHLGFIFICLSVGRDDLCIFHLFVHALFKSVIFMCAGNYIQARGHSQDMRDLGRLWVSCPLSCVYLMIC